jgi:uncharacterized protein YkwD
MARAITPRLLVALCLALLALPAAAHSAGKGKRAEHCADANLVPAPGNLADVRAAVLCLHNHERSARGLAPLREHARLRRAARRHSADMVGGGFFSHDAPGGSDMSDRVLATGYGRGANWSIGENIGYATGKLATAAEVHRAWMRSPGHRSNILRREFREIGIGIVLGAPVDAYGLGGATYTTDFGVRH